MSSPFKSLHIKSASQSRTYVPINAGHITTFDFGQILPVFQAETIAADAWKLPDCSAFSRMMPLYVPTFGKCDLKLLSFFVPYHQVAEDYEAWRANMSSWDGYLHWEIRLKL